MNSRIRNFYIFIGFIIILIGYSFFTQYRANKSFKSNDFEASWKENQTNGEVKYSEKIDTINMIYSNYKYGIAIDFPDKWKLDKGVSEYSLIRGLSKDSGITFNITVVEVKDAKLDANMWQIWDKNELGSKDVIKQSLSKMVNSKIQKFTDRKVYVDNLEGIEVRFTYGLKYPDGQYDVQGIVYWVYIMPYTYTMGIQVPKMFFEKNPDWYNSLINNVVFRKNINRKQHNT